MNVTDKQSSELPIVISTHAISIENWSAIFNVIILCYRKLQRFLLDQRTTPLDTAIYWTEYVLRHNGAYHLQAPSRNYRCVYMFVLLIEHRMSKQQKLE